MSAKRSKPWVSTSLSRALQEYLEQQQIKQQPLADYLNVDVRTLRRWLSGDTVITDVRELKRIAELLEVKPEKLGVTASLPIPLAPDEIDTSIDHVWKLVRTARYHDADVLVNKLIRDISSLLHTEDAKLLRKLAYAQHVAGFVKSQVTRADETAIPFAHYNEMERIARILGDQALISVALTYEGDMLQRGGKIEQSIQYLEAVRDTPSHIDVSVRGNGIQLLGRAYFKAQRFADFERVMKEAEALAHEPQIADLSNNVKGQYGAGTVYEEWGRSLGLLGRTNEAMEYLDKAEDIFSQTWILPRRNMLMKTARAMVLVRDGEIQQGVEMAVEALDLCRKQGNIRLLERIYGIHQYLNQLTREIGTSKSILGEALVGPVDY